MTTMDLDVCMETVEHQTTVPVKWDGRVPTAIFVFHCLDVNMALARMPLNVTVMKDGKEHTVIFLAVAIVPMDNVLHPMNVSAIMDG